VDSPAETPASTSSARGFLGLLRLWFGVRLPVSRGAYAASGFGLMAFKYGVEAWVIHATTGAFLSPFQFLNPGILDRQQLLAGAPPWLGPALLVWTLPFLWIAVSMSVRRAADYGDTPWFGLTVLVPFLNTLFMLFLCVIPGRVPGGWQPRQEEVRDRGSVPSALAAVLLAVLITLPVVVLGVYLLDYGATLFVGAPLIAGAFSAWLFNLQEPRSWSETLGIASLTVVVPALALLLFALEGLICVLMSLPLVLVVGILGGVIGKAIAGATHRPPRDAFTALFLVPLFAGADLLPRATPLEMACTTVEVAAAPEEVWRQVIAFSPLPAPEEWYFRAGIAYPTHATIDGSGVGALRRCVFSTGEFLEPITAWEPGRLLAFDVTAQPSPLRELSPYGDITPPHLAGQFRVRRGEFRLQPLPGGGTRLEGRTWYQLETAPRGYWLLWTDAILHAIHRRVLAHIQAESERAGPDRSAGVGGR
jgi:hypothetical protein